MINTNGDEMVGAYIGFSFEPEYIIAHDFRHPQEVRDYLASKDNPPTHWGLHGVVNDELQIVYEEKDGVVLKNLFTEESFISYCNRLLVKQIHDHKEKDKTHGVYLPHKI